MNEQISKSLKQVNTRLQEVLFKELRGPVKAQILNILKRRFSQVAEDYQEFLIPVSDLEESKVDSWVGEFLSMAERDYEESLSKAIITDSGISIDLGFVGESELGFDDNNESPLSWVYYYITGQRETSFFVSSHVLENILDTSSLPREHPRIQMIIDALNERVGEFGDGFFMPAHEYVDPNVEYSGVRWSDILSEKQITPFEPSSSFSNFLEEARQEIGQTIREAIEGVIRESKLG